MEPHGQHPGELEKGFAWRYVEASSHDLDHVIMDLLEHVDEALRSIWFIPELATVGDNGKANCIEDEPPVGHAETPNCVA